MCRLLLAALFAAFATAASAQCLPVADVVARFEAHSMTESVQIASPAETVIAVQLFNAMPPESDDKYNVVILATSRAGGGVVFVGNDDQVCVQMNMPPSQWRAFIRSVRGEAS